jgi:hypothetical protein
MGSEKKVENCPTTFRGETEFSPDERAGGRFALPDRHAGQGVGRIYGILKKSRDVFLNLA